MFLIILLELTKINKKYEKIEKEESKLLIIIISRLSGKLRRFESGCLWILIFSPFWEVTPDRQAH